MADGVSIDPGQVSATARQIREDASTYFSASVDRGRDLHEQGVMFGGRYPGGAIVQAKQQYAEALSILDANLRNYQLTAELYAEAAERIAREFAHVDHNSAQSQAIIQRALGEAAGVVAAKYGVPGPSAQANPTAAAQPAAGSTTYAGGML